MPHFMSIEEELAEEEQVLRAEQEWFLSTQVQPSLEAIQKALIACQDAARLQDDTKGALTLAISSTNFIVKGELVVKLPKQPVIKAAIHSQAPTTNVVPSSLTVPSMITATGTGSVAGSSAGSSRNSTDIAENSEEAKDASALAQQMNSQDSQPQASPSESSSTTTVAIVAPIGSHVNPHQLMHRPPGHLTQPYLLEQLKDVQNHTSQALLRLEDYWKTGVVGSNQPPKDIKESTRPLKTLLELLQRHLRAGIEAMAQPNKEKLYPFRVCDPKIFSPALSEDFVIEFYIRDSQLVCAAYALQLTGGSGSGSTFATSTSTNIYGISDRTLVLVSDVPQSQLVYRCEPSFYWATRSLSTATSAGSSRTGAVFVITTIDSFSVVLPASSKVGQTGKGGINKYRGKVATTLEDKMVQVQSSKLSEISAKLSAAEGLCRRLLHFLVLQESVVSSNGI
ncbi:hypothetical protein BG005_010084 [Podila minutissima]|nr:hypothetical protein BG005_010084 [Podila minutissima]